MRAASFDCAAKHALSNVEGSAAPLRMLFPDRMLALSSNKKIHAICQTRVIRVQKKPRVLFPGHMINRKNAAPIIGFEFCFEGVARGAGKGRNAITKFADEARPRLLN